MPDLSGFAAIGFAAAAMASYAFLGAFPLLYVFVRWRTGGGEPPGVGLRAGLLYLRSVALLVFVTGLALLLHSLVDEYSDSRSMTDQRRVAGGLLLAGGLGFALQLSLLASLASERAAPSPSTDRLFQGFVLMVSGTATLVTLTIACVVLFQRDTDFDDLRPPLVWTAVWIGTFLLHAVALVRGVPRGHGRAGGPS